MADQNGSDTKTTTTSKTPGTTFNIKQASAQPGTDGKTSWTLIGRAFIRADGTGGAIFVGEGDNERRYSLFPKTRVHKAGSEAANGAQRPAAQAGGGL